MRVPRSITLALVLSLASLFLVTPAFLLGSRYSTWGHRLPTFHDLTYWGKPHPNPLGGVGSRIGYLDPVLAFHYLGAAPWYFSRDLGFPEPLQDYQVAIPAFSALSWGLLGVLLGVWLDRRYCRQLARWTAPNPSPAEVRLASDFRRRALRGAVWSAGILIASGIVVLCILPPVVTLSRISSLKSSDPAVRRPAVRALSLEARIGIRFWPFPRPRIVPASSGDGEVPIDWILVKDLRRTGDRLDMAWPTLVTMAGDPDMEIRREVIRTLGSAGLHPSATARVILSVLDDPSATVFHDDAIESLVRLGYSSPEVLAGIIRATKPPFHEYVREQAVFALGTLGVDDRPTLDLLIDLLAHGEPALRESAARALTDRGPAAEPAVPFLVAAIVPDGSRLTACARYALCAIARNPRQSVPALIDALKDSGDRKLQELAAQTLGGFGPDAKDALPALRQLIRDSDPRSPQFVAAAKAIAAIDR